MELQSPPFFEHLLLESPAPLIVALLALSVGLVIIAFRRVSVRHLLAGGGVALMAAGVALLAMLVTTEREKVQNLTTDLVNATAPLDKARLDALIDPDATIVNSEGTRMFTLPEGLARLAQIQARVPAFSHSVIKLSAQTDESEYARSVVSLITACEIADSPTYAHTRWLLTWHRDAAGQYHVTEVRWLSIDGKPVTRGSMR